MDYSSSDPAGGGFLSDLPRRRKDCHVPAQGGRNAHREVLTTLGDACWLSLKEDLHGEGEADQGLFSGCSTARGPRRRLRLGSQGSCTWLQHWGSIVLRHAAELACWQSIHGKCMTTTTAKWKGCPNQVELLGGVDNLR